MLEIEGEKLFGVRYTIKEEGKDKKYFNSGDEWYYYDEGSKTWKACDETNCGQDPQGKINKAIAQQCGYDTNADQQSAEVQACMERLAEDQYSQTGFANMIMEEREFTFQEGLQLGSTLWGLGVKFKLWSEADNPMAQLNDYFANTKTGMLLTGEWEKLICWETTDFNNPNDGIAFVPGTENVGAWIAGEYVKYTHPLISDPNRKVTEYIYRITSSVDPSGLTENSGSANCMDFLEFQYTMDNKVVDLDMDGMTSDDTVRLACDSGGFSMTGANALVRNSTKLYSMACIKFSPSFLKQGFSENLNGGMLCAPIVPSGYEYTTRCDFCVPFLAGTGLGPASGGIGFGSSMPTSYGAAVAENRPGVVNPSSMG